MFTHNRLLIVNPLMWSAVSSVQRACSFLRLQLAVGLYHYNVQIILLHGLIIYRGVPLEDQQNKYHYCSIA